MSSLNVSTPSAVLAPQEVFKLGPKPCNSDSIQYSTVVVGWEGPACHEGA